MTKYLLQIFLLFCNINPLFLAAFTKAIPVKFRKYTNEIEDRKFREKKKKAYDHCFLGRGKRDKFCYINIPKNGSTTLHTILNLEYYWYSDVSNKISDYKKIISVRDPMYRPISIFNEMMLLRRDGPYQITQELEFYKQKENLIESFNLFLQEVEGNFYDHHMDLQCEALIKKGLTLSDMDYIFLIEDFSNDLSKFCRVNNIPYNSENCRSTPKCKKSILREYINQNPHIQEQIYKVWEKDFLFYEEAKKARNKINHKYLNPKGL